MVKKISIFFLTISAFCCFVPAFAQSANREAIIYTTLDVIEGELKEQSPRIESSLAAVDSSPAIRTDLVIQALDEIEHILTKPQSVATAANFFSDFNLRSPLLDILSLYQIYRWPILSFVENESRLFDSYSQIRGLEEEGSPVWNIGTEFSYIKYVEPDVMKEEGTMQGLSGSYTSYGQFMSESFMLRLEAKISSGQVDYENSGTINDIDDYMFEFRGLGGLNYPASYTVFLRPYFGFGYRYLNDDTSGLTSSTGALGYERESNYFYSPLGLEVAAKLLGGWFWGFAVEYDHFWMGAQKSHLSGVNVAFNDLENNQNDGYGFRVSAKIGKETPKFDFIFEPFIKYWNIEKSEEDYLTYAGIIWGYGYEPANNSTEIGGKFAIEF